LKKKLVDLKAQTKNPRGKMASSNTPITVASLQLRLDATIARVFTQKSAKSYANRSTNDRVWTDEQESAYLEQRNLRDSLQDSIKAMNVVAAGPPPPRPARQRARRRGVATATNEQTVTVGTEVAAAATTATTTFDINRSAVEMEEKDVRRQETFDENGVIVASVSTSVAESKEVSVETGASHTSQLDTMLSVHESFKTQNRATLADQSETLNQLFLMGYGDDAMSVADELQWVVDECGFGSMQEVLHLEEMDDVVKVVRACVKNHRPFTALIG
jgi:hypothetical protein